MSLCLKKIILLCIKQTYNMKRIITLAILTVILAASCTISYKFNGASIDYSKIKSITIAEFPNNAALHRSRAAARQVCPAAVNLSNRVLRRRLHRLCTVRERSACGLRVRLVHTIIFLNFKKCCITHKLHFIFLSISLIDTRR